MKRTRLYNRRRDLLFDVEQDGGAVVIEYRVGPAVARIHLPARDPKSLLVLTDELWRNDVGIHETLVEHLSKGRPRRVRR